MIVFPKVFIGDSTDDVFPFLTLLDEYNLGYRNQVVALFQTESPPPPPTTTYISNGELDHMVRDCASPLQRIGRSLDCDLPQHVAEKSSKNVFLFWVQYVSKLHAGFSYLFLSFDGSTR